MTAVSDYSDNETSKYIHQKVSTSFCSRSSRFHFIPLCNTTNILLNEIEIYRTEMKDEYLFASSGKRRTSTRGMVFCLFYSPRDTHPRIDREPEMATSLSTHRSLRSKYELPLIIYLPWPKAIDRAWFDNDCLDVPRRTRAETCLSFVREFATLVGDGSSRMEVKSRLEIAIQFLLGSSCRGCVFLPPETKARGSSTHTRPKGGIKTRVKISRSSFRLSVRFCNRKSSVFLFSFSRYQAWRWVKRKIVLNFNLFYFLSSF